MFHVLTPFPLLLNFDFYAPLLLRLVLSFYVLMIGFGAKKEEGTDVKSSAYTKALRVIFIVAGISILAGYYLQISSAVSAILFIVMLFVKKARMNEKLGKGELVLLITICISLLILGAGAFAIDLPL